MSNVIYSYGVPVPKVDDAKLHFANRLTILYGPSGSGKSSITNHLINTLRDTIPLAIVCCPTAALNGDYANILPDQCIYDDVTKPLMRKIFQRQTNVMAMYELVRDVHHLTPLFKLITDRDAKDKVERLAAIYRKGCADIKNSYGPEDAESTTGELTIKYNKKLVKLMRAGLINNMEYLQSQNLTEMQRTILSNLNINPALLLIIDDCMASIKEWAPMEETKKLFFQGRHYKLASFILTQSETLIPPQLRSNAHISIFTTESIVNTFISKASSGIPPDQRKLISKIAETIFAPSTDRAKPNYRKLVVFGQIVPTDSKIQYIIGTPKRKRFGSAALWQICEMVKRESSSTVNSTSFTKMFSMRIKPSLESL